MWINATLLALVAAVAACGDKDRKLNPAGPDCSPTPGAALSLAQVATGLTDPVLLTFAPNDARLFILERPGRVRVVDDAGLSAAPFGDITDRVLSAGGEQGLLGLAFHPRFADNGRLFVNYTAREPAGATVVAEYGRAADGTIDTTRERRLLTIEQFAANHNGGHIAFGPDGLLYIGTGDGGGGGDPRETGQDLTSLLGKLLRIDVDRAQPYAVPPDNPFVGRGNGVRGEVFAYGLRNPWRWSFDRVTGDIYIGDVGQNRIEEVDRLPRGRAGLNFGWDDMEGSACFEDPNCADNPDLVRPITEYTHDSGCSITGGYVYRGECLPDYIGRYFYGDYCADNVVVATLQDGAVTAETDIKSELDPGRAIDGLVSFGEDVLGELYIVSIRGGGSVYKVVPR